MVYILLSVEFNFKLLLNFLSMKMKVLIASPFVPAANWYEGSLGSIWNSFKNHPDLRDC